jgi:dihydropteroate synthase
MADVVSRADASVVLMHMKGSPADMQRGGSPDYADVIGEIAAFLGERRDFEVARGVGAERILLDPGIGFGKRVAHNLRILNHLDQFTALGCPVLIGASRKSFIGEVLGVESPAMRLSGSLACAAVAVLNGAAVIRTHDVRETVEVVRMVEAIRMADAGRWNESAP